MDEIVKAAMAKWPQVPDCRGWLGLDARGRWWMRDAAAQAAGPFAGPMANAQSRGSELKHDKLIEFIGRNYAPDGQGQWYFQNGPQRVYVELALTPWIWRLHADGRVVSHTGRPALYRESWLDEEGRLYLVCDLGLGVVHTLDMALAADQVESGVWAPQISDVPTLSAHYGFVRSPEAEAAGRPPPSSP